MKTITIDTRIAEELLNGGAYAEQARNLLRQKLEETTSDEDIMRDGVAAHVRRYCHPDRMLCLKVFPREESERDSSGMLEWILEYEFGGGGGITIGMIQRAPGEAVEYHS